MTIEAQSGLVRRYRSRVVQFQLELSSCTKGCSLPRQSDRLGRAAVEGVGCKSNVPRPGSVSRGRLQAGSFVNDTSTNASDIEQT